ncbi:stage II sporulation protein P [Oceanobacillus polygoni]|uniref:Stage II sporulation protein P n=1 Tax=Oceanobacillus polygoni TaxID=1235259 RepID=A0A9X0Z217_9BACI|nr:stage II sporulation protein P [Oceanobacillus polygoni]MBP2079696.1 stage II sporulation protein P [Oceanobacillus polygoni]
MKYTIISLFLTFIVTFVTVMILLTTEISSASIKQAISNISTDNFLYLITLENRSFEKALPETFKKPSPLDMAFELGTDISIKDIRTLLGREIPGLTLYGPEIIINDDSDDVPRYVHESPPPLDSLLEEKEINEDSLKENKQGAEKEDEDEGEFTNIGEEDVTVLIYHTHSWESYLPHLKTSEDDPDSASHNEVNITLVGERFGEELEKRGFNVIMDSTNMTEELHKRNWETYQSYDLSREFLQKHIDENKIDFIFDLHRDSARKETTTIKINEEKLARPFFVVGQGHDKYEENLLHASELHALIEQEYPGLPRKLLSYPKTEGRNGVYNQDLSEQLYLMEVGGVDNMLEESYNTVEIVAEMFARYYLKLEEG